MKADRLTELFERAKHLWKEGRHEESNEVYFSLLENKELVTDVYAVYRDIGDNYAHLDRQQEAKTWLKKCLEIPVVSSSFSTRGHTGMPCFVHCSVRFWVSPLFLS